MRRGDRLIGIVLGIVVGIAIVAVFVFVFSEDTVDAPSIDNGAPTEQPYPALAAEDRADQARLERLGARDAARRR